MKRVLVTGASGYIATNFCKWMKSYDGYEIKPISVRDGQWRKVDFSDYDVVVHTAGIAHVDEKKKKASDYQTVAKRYYEVNTKLTIELAHKAKNEGVGQFIFCSSIIVYGESRLGEEMVIEPETGLAPFGYYGDSKLKAEKEIGLLADSDFTVTILRLPMVYGKDCKGNYRKLEWLAGWTPVFPDYKNSRSILEIRRLCQYMKQAIDRNAAGIYHLQDEACRGTTDIMRELAEERGRRIAFTGLFNPFLSFFGKRIRAVNKAFGSMTYSDEVTWKLEQSETPGMLVSIITVAYNSEKTIRDTIESVLAQDYEMIEYIVIDGNSSDRTCSIAEEYREMFLKKGYSYRIISEPDEGIYDAMNKGIDASHGTVIGIINSDDWYEPCAVTKMMEMYKKTDFDMFYANLRMVKEDALRNGEQEQKGRVKQARCRCLATSRDWNHPTTFITREVYQQYRYKLESVHDDWDLVLKIRKAGYKIVVLDEVLANFRMGGVSNRRSLGRSMQRFKARYRIYRNNGYSRWYLLECLMIETAKFLLA